MILKEPRTTYTPTVEQHIFGEGRLLITLHEFKPPEREVAIYNSKNFRRAQVELCCVVMFNLIFITMEL